MSEKRKRDISDKPGDDAKSKKKARRGFVVGPDNLPDGAYKRKTQRIKENLIQRAQIKKNYAKLKRQGNAHEDFPSVPKPASADPKDDTHQPTTAPHPDRQALIEEDDEPPEVDSVPAADPRRPKRKPKPAPFQRDYKLAQKRKAEAEERRKAREEAERQRQEKLEERERFRKAMAKARTGGPNGQRKLGRESKVLLEKVRRMVGGDA